MCWFSKCFSLSKFSSDIRTTLSIWRGQLTTKHRSFPWSVSTWRAVEFNRYLTNTENDCSESVEKQESYFSVSLVFESSKLAQKTDALTSTLFISFEGIENVACLYISNKKRFWVTPCCSSTLCWSKIG